MRQTCAVVITEYTLDGTAPNISNEVINQWIILSSQIYKQPDFKVVDKIVTSLISTLCEIGLCPAKVKLKRSPFKHIAFEKLFSNCVMTFLIRC